ncbi:MULTISPECIES: Zn-ribbon domain-containing OB-fold protein [Mycobacteriaceae]|uniref:Zn-ribbon domain-containing OB-fold protein n=1 Tax=Mycobacteriaceae TaxID=1762 RepID=UPI0018D23689|nr:MULTISPECIES: OB-fold domain-containing protein [Mycobacteriaceae]
MPAPDDVSGFFWNAAAEHRLVLQRCGSCRTLQYPPEVCCSRCQAQDFEPAEVSGRGFIYSYAVVDRPLHAGFIDALPYVVVLVELDEQPGLRILTNLVGVPDGTALSCGMRVEVVYANRGSLTLPQFRLSEAA